MSEPLAALAASYSHYRRVKGRKVHEVVFEIPSEKWPAAYDVLGEPKIDGSDWYAFAKLTPAAAEQYIKQAKPAAQSPSSVPIREKRVWKAVSPAEQAGMRCLEPAFKRYLADEHGLPDNEDPADYVRGYCGVASRAELNGNFQAAQRWGRLSDGYDAWMRTA